MNTAKFKKFIISFCMAVIVMALFTMPSSAQEKERLSASAHFTMPNGFEYDTEIISARHKIFDEYGNVLSYDRYYSFVFPHNAKNREITLTFNNVDYFYRGDSIYNNGGSYILEEGIYTAVAFGEEYEVKIKYTSDIYQIYLTLENEIKYIEEEKDRETGGDILITNGISTEYDGHLEYIKGRGNASWAGSKKPYNIKLSTKAKLLGMDASKKYALTPLYVDISAVREKVSVTLGRLAGIEYCMDGTHIDLYVNGEYRGMYYLTEKVEVDSGRVEILDLEAVNEQLNPGIRLEELAQMGDFGENSFKIKSGYKWTDIPGTMADSLGGGYLLEYDIGSRCDAEQSGFVSEYGQPVVLKSPEYATKGQVEYIREYYQQFEDALLSDDGYNSLGKHYSEYINEESFAKMYVFQEYALNLDAAMTSAFMYKDVNSKLTMCTAWDLDNGYGCYQIINGIDLRKPDEIWAMVSTHHSKEEKNIFFLLCQHAQFRHLAAEVWQKNFAPHIDTIISEAELQQNLIYDSAEANQCRWKLDRIFFEDFIKENEKVRAFMRARADFMDMFMHTEAVYISYMRNGAEGAMLDKYSYMPGSDAIVMENEFCAGDAVFLGWNTRADGSGTTYMPGDILPVGTEDTALYAQWDNLKAQDTIVQKENDRGFWGGIISWFKNLLG